MAAAGVAAAFRDDAGTRPAGLAYIVWGWNEEALDEAPNSRSLYCPKTVEVRVRALARHESQMTDLISDAPEAFTLAPEVRAITTRTSEVYLELS